jgi:hypothetical protein
MYKKVLCIELHDSHSVITDDDSQYSEPIGRPSFSFRKPFFINLGDLRKIMNMLEIDTISKWQNRDDEWEFVEDINIPLQMEYTDCHDELAKNVNIEAVYCDVAAPHMVNIRIEYSFDEEKAIEESTYCGNFTIWWA